MNNEQEIEKREVTSKIVTFKVTATQYNKLKEAAKQEKRNISDYIKLKLELL